MELEKLNELMHQNLDIVKRIDGYKSILDRGNNLLRFDVLNRILIAIQDSNAYDLKTREEWLIVGREIVTKAQPIYIVLPKTLSKYIDIESGNVIQDDDLNSEEILKALEYNIIKREDTIDELYTMVVYDIRQTKKLNNAEYVVNKPKLNSRILLDILSKITEATIELCDESYYSKSENTIFIQKKAYNELAYTIAEFITQYFMEFKINDIIHKDFGFTDNYLGSNETKLLKTSILHSLLTLFAVKSELSFDILYDIEIDKIVDILNIVDSIIVAVIPYLTFTTNESMNDAVTNITRLKKSEIILDIMEANSIHNKLNSN